MFNSGYFQRPIGRGVKNLLIINAAVFVIGLVFNSRTVYSATGMSVLAGTFGLTRSGLLHGMLWQPVTYMFLHASLTHLILNMLGLYFFGPEVESTLGTRRFIRLYLLCGVLGGIGWLLLSAGGGAVCVGASAAIFGIVGCFAGMFPARKITLLVYFVLPVTMTALTMALLFAGISILMLIGGGRGVAHAAHLAGLAAGYWYGRNVNFATLGRRDNLGYGGYQASYGSRKKKWSFSELRAWYRRSRYRVLPKDDTPVDWERVNAILDKIRFRGVNSLTREEKAVLDRASRGRK